jgi:protein tyrosine/serine phosphatase
MVSRATRYLLGLLIVAMLVGGPYAYSRQQRSKIRNFRVVEDGKLYRSGQNSLYGMEVLLRDYGIRTVISLRFSANPDGRPPDWQEEQFCKNLGINYVRIRPREWVGGENDGMVPAQGGVDKLLEVMDDPKNQPVLIHCFAGMHRTGIHCAIYRMEYDHWTNAEAMGELYSLGYTHLYEQSDVMGYLTNYVPRWKRNLPQD